MQRLVAGPAHGHADPGGPQHRDIVSAVAEGHRLRGTETETFRKLRHAGRLVDAAEVDVREDRAPARGDHRGQPGHDAPFELRIDVETHLAAVAAVEQAPQVDHLGNRMGHQAGDLLDDGRHTVDEDAVVEFQPDREIQLRGEGHRLLELRTRNQVPGHDLAVAHQAIGAIEGHDPVVGDLFQSGEVPDGTPRSDEEPHAAAVGPAQGIECRRRHFVGPEADERSVDIEE